MVPPTAHAFPVRRDDVTFPDIVLLSSACPLKLVSGLPAESPPVTASPAAPADLLSPQIGLVEAVELADG